MINSTGLVKRQQNLDNKISLNTQTNQTLEAIAQAIFKSWFVDFEPVKAKMAALEAGGTAKEAERAAMCAISGKDEAALTRLQTEQPKAYAELAQTAALFSSAMQDSELGEIPEEWDVVQLKAFGQIVCGKTPSKMQSEMFGQDVPFIKIPDMHSSMFVVSPTEHLSEIGAVSQIKKMLPRGSICVSCIATVGKVVITTRQSQTNQQINSIIPEHESYTPYLYFYMLTLEKMFHDLASGGSATLNMNTSTFSGIEIAKPNMELLREFNKRVQVMFREIENGLNQNIELSEIRDTLLPRFLSGETKVGDTGV